MKKSIGELIDKKKIGRGYSGFLECNTCGEKFKSTQARIDRGLGKYCSKKCYGIAVTGSIRPGLGEKISKTKQEKSIKINIKCEVCKKNIILTPGTIKGRRTCSRECGGKLVSRRLREMWKNPPQEMIGKMREKMIQRRSKGRLEKETKPEKIFREELEKRNIIFEPQFAFGGLMIADFFIPSLQAFIFVDGSYWHSLPSSKEKDWQQVEFAKSKGMKAYRFSDNQVFEDVSRCVDEVYEDAEQPFSFAELLDKYSVLAIKKEFSPEEKINQVLKDYRRMEKLALSGLEFYNIENPDEVVELIKKLFETNCKIFALMENGNDLAKVKTLNKYRSDLKNAINKHFDERQELKTYE